MGRMKEEWLDYRQDQYQLSKREWIKEQLGLDAEEDHEEWDDLAAEFDEMSEKLEEGDYYLDAFNGWVVKGKTRYSVFSETLDSCGTILINHQEIKGTEITDRSLFVMIYAHIVSAIESYLSSTFIDVVLASKDLTKKLAETDKEIKKKRFTAAEVLEMKEEHINDFIRKHLQDLIFHNIGKVKPMYRLVLGIDLGDVGWLAKAVMVRHDCVHRAGYSKEGDPIEISHKDLEILKNNAINLVSSIENDLLHSKDINEF